MPKFTYVAVGPDGQTTSGVEKASSRDAIEVELYNRQLRDIRVTEKTSFLQTEISGPRIKREDLMHVSRQMGAFVSAGLPILDAVHTIAREADNSSVRRVMLDIEDGLRTGERFSDCLDRHPKVFPDYYRGIVRASELTGELDTVLGRLSIYIERDLEARRKITAALIYPAIILVLAISVVIVLAVYVLPKFQVLFHELHLRHLPLPTRMLLAVTSFLAHWWWALLGGFGLIVVVVVLVVQTDEGRYARDRLLTKIPLIGTTLQYALVERFCRLLASMVSAGVALPEALRVATESLRNRVYVRSLSGVNEAMLEGAGIATPLARTGLFPTTAVQMLRVGEETGTLDRQLEVAAQYYETELDYKIKKATSLIEPIVIVVMGLLVGFVAVALVSAMYGVFNQVKV